MMEINCAVTDNLIFVDVRLTAILWIQEELINNQEDVGRSGVVISKSLPMCI